MLGILLAAFFIGSATAIASSSGEDSKESSDVEKPEDGHSSTLTGPDNHYSHTRQWEDPDSGDYWKHKIDITIDE